MAIYPRRERTVAGDLSLGILVFGAPSKGFCVRSFKFVLFAAATAAGAWGAYPLAAAQRTDENALESAEDAFGTTVGGETIGLYSATSARGFSPVRAGNLRIEGLFFDVRGAGGNNVRISQRLIGQTTVRVGLSAQSYPFPSPTGIADYTLRLPGDEYALSSVFRAAYPETEAIELDGQVPMSKNFSVGIGLGAERSETDFAIVRSTLDGALIGRWNVGDAIQVIPFYSRIRQFDDRWNTNMFAAGAVLPVKYDRSQTLTQTWSPLDNDDANYGTIVKANWAEWNLGAGLFRSTSLRRFESAQLHFRNIQPNGDAELWRVRIAEQDEPNTSLSGEARLSRTFVEGNRRHTFFFNGRGKRLENSYGGNVSRFYGMGNILQPMALPEPEFTAGPQGREYVRQLSGGVSYQVLWRDVGELSAGLQRVRYTRYTQIVDPTPSETTNHWLYNATLAAYLTQKLALYSSYTRGLEDAPRAPPFAVNSGASASATRTSQIDGGFRYTVLPGVNFVAGLFEVKKPFFELDQRGIFGPLGNVRHRGFEASLSGNLAPGLTVVGGLVGLKARLSGPLVSNGTMGEIPPGTVPLTGLFSVQYGPQSWNGFSIDGRVAHNDSYTANVENSFKSESITLVDIGARYRFRMADNPALLRLQVTNLFDTWEWQVEGTQRQLRASPRRKVMLQLTVDY
jgi:iron complex outermembrane recepter protein